MPRIVGFVHDRGAGAMKVLRERNWSVDEKLDQNHVLNAKFRLIFNKYNAVVIEVSTPKASSPYSHHQLWRCRRVGRRYRRPIDGRSRSSRASCGVTSAGS
jgi:hypothetical protein